jgi:type IV secretion system protein TrbD
MSTLGFRIKVHNALTTPLTIAGVPRNFAILNGTICLAFVLGLRAFYTLPLFIILHFIAALMTKNDPHFFEVLSRHIKQKKYYRV